MTKQNKAYLFALLAVLFWSTAATAFKMTFRYTDFVTLLWYASLVSLVVLFGIITVQGKVALLRRMTRRQLLRSLAGGVLNPFLYYMILFKAYSELPAQEAQPLNYTWPVVIALLAVPVLGDKLSPRSVAALLVSFAGVVVISTRGDIFGLRFANPFGAALAVGSSLIWASFWLLNVTDRRDPVVKLFLNFVFGFLLLSAASLTLARAGIAVEQIHATFSSERAIVRAYAFPPSIHLNGLLGCIYIGCFEMGFTFVLWLKALSLTEKTAKVSNLILLSPFISLIFIRFIVGEHILFSSVIGLTLIIAGVAIQRTVK
jgi:drug/metabolite transporter (DMT)-like permease